MNKIIIFDGIFLDTFWTDIKGKNVAIYLSVEIDQDV